MDFVVCYLLPFSLKQLLNEQKNFIQPNCKRISTVTSKTTRQERMTTANSSPCMSSVVAPEQDLNMSLTQSPMAASKAKALMDLQEIKSVKTNNNNSSFKSVKIIKSDNPTTNKMSQQTNKLAAMLPSQASDEQALALGKEMTVTTAKTGKNKKSPDSAQKPQQKKQKQQKQKQKKQKQKQKQKNKGTDDNKDDLQDDMSFLSKDCDLIGMPGWVINLMSNQPTLNIMTIGDVSHGKSTLMWGLCDEKTGRHSSELKNNMTIKLGYTSCKVFKCINCMNSNSICYFSVKSEMDNKKVQCPKCGQKQPFVLLVRHISFVDCPGHAEYMGTMISAACVVCIQVHFFLFRFVEPVLGHAKPLILALFLFFCFLYTQADGAVMVIDASRAFPGEQTVQHTSAAHLLGVLTNGTASGDQDEKTEETANNRIKVIVAQNKIDLINRQKACQNVTDIRYFLNKYSSKLGRNTPIIPISAQSKLNLDALCMCMVKNYPMCSPRLLKLDKILSSPPRSLSLSLSPSQLSSQQKSNDSSSLLMNIIRTFDVNRPRELKTMADIDKLLHGGVLGGVIIDGTISIGDKICIRPGIIRNSPTRGTLTTKRLTTSQQVKKLLEPKFVYQPIECRVIGLKCGIKKLQCAYPGANVGVMLNIDPCLTKHDSLVGQIACNPNMIDANKKFPVFNVFVMSYILLKPFENIGLKKLEGIKVNIGSSNMRGFIVKRNVDLPDKLGKGIMIVLEQPICAKIASQVTLTRKINGVWRLAVGGVIFTARQCPQVNG